MKNITIGVIAHVDHGKTTLVDQLLKQGGAFAAHQEVGNLIMDSNDQEKERGITIYAKNCSIKHNETIINIVDTPGHADFSSEVERVLRVVDTVLLLVDAQEGPMPQTRFVTQKAIELGLKPIVVINKIDKPAADPKSAIDKVYELFIELDASEEQLDFPIIYAIAKEGIAKKELEDQSNNLNPLFDTISERATEKDISKPFQALVYALDYSEYSGRIGIAKIVNGKVSKGENISLIQQNGEVQNGKISKLIKFQGNQQIDADSAENGDIVGIAGFKDVTIGTTFANQSNPKALPIIEIGKPTVSMVFSTNTSPFAGKEGKNVTSRTIYERLQKELETNVGLKVEQVEGSESYRVSGRGELHLAVLIETMRREGFELSVSKPNVIFREENGQKLEPIESLFISVPTEYSGTVIEKLNKRKAEMQNMGNKNNFTELEFIIPTRGLIGYNSEFIYDTHGEGIISHIFKEYAPYKGSISGRTNGVLISQCAGKALGYALNNLQERGTLFIKPATDVYEGMIIGKNARNEDLVVNPTKGKQLTNMRASGNDDGLQLEPPLIMTLEQALEFIDDDELVEVTPSSIRLRKKLLSENERKRVK
ncbi:translational GTPase TypA [Candidatus Peregrinibacteria bacterium]|nr:translational GTPase TypA [Candidatus Peregrinibacteria bacterium]